MNVLKKITLFRFIYQNDLLLKSNCSYLFLKPATDKVPNISVEYPMGFWYNNQPATKNQTTKFIQKAVEDLKMQPGNGSGLTGHSIKATAITQLARTGVQDSEIMKSSRH
jgi:hypothetical protein